MSLFRFEGVIPNELEIVTGVMKLQSPYQQAERPVNVAYIVYCRQYELVVSCLCMINNIVLLE